MSFRRVGVILGTLLVASLSGLIVVGCSNQPAPVAVEPETAPANATAKVVLEGVAETGELGSGLEELRMALEEMKQTDPAKAEALLADLEKLEASATPEAAKAKATEMMGKL